MAMAIGEISQRCAMAGGARRGEGLAQGCGGQEAGGRQAASSVCGVWAVGGAPPLYQPDISVIYQRVPDIFFISLVSA